MPSPLTRNEPQPLDLDKWSMLGPGGRAIALLVARGMATRAASQPTPRSTREALPLLPCGSVDVEPSQQTVAQPPKAWFKSGTFSSIVLTPSLLVGAFRLPRTIEPFLLISLSIAKPHTRTDQRGESLEANREVSKSAAHAWILSGLPYGHVADWKAYLREA